MPSRSVWKLDRVRPVARRCGRRLALPAAPQGLRRSVGLHVRGHRSRCLLVGLAASDPPGVRHFKQNISTKSVTTDDQVVLVSHRGRDAADKVGARWLAGDLELNPGTDARRSRAVIVLVTTEWQWTILSTRVPQGNRPPARTIRYAVSLTRVLSWPLSSILSSDLLGTLHALA
jgi:hypothetical protein